MGIGSIVGRNPESLKIALAELGDSAIGLAGDAVDPKSTGIAEDDAEA